MSTTIFTISNFLSILRAPLALLLLHPEWHCRLIAIVLAMATDCMDGYLARKTHSVTRLGVVLDPLMDKFFVLFGMAAFLREGALEMWEALAMLSRDCALLFFGGYLNWSGHWPCYAFRAIKWGKVTTALQFVVLIALSMSYPVPPGVFWTFWALGVCSFIELMHPLVGKAVRSD